MKKNSDGTFKSSQPNQVDKIINHISLAMSISLQSRETPAEKSLLHKETYSLGSKCVWNYRSEIGIMIYIYGSTQPEISMALHQCEHFYNNPCLVHICTIRCISNYPVRTSTYVDSPGGNWRLSTRGVVYNPDKEKGINCYVDANFAGGRAQVDANNAENFMLRMGYVITYAGCPLLWCSKLQTEISFSTV